MPSRTTFPSREPAITVGSIGALVAAILALLVAFGLPISEELEVAILGVVAVATPIVISIITRTFVSPAWQVDDAKSEAEGLRETNDQLEHDRDELAKALVEEKRNPTTTVVHDEQVLPRYRNDEPL